MFEAEEPSDEVLMQLENKVFFPFSMTLMMRMMLIQGTPAATIMTV
jgi:hypothetical protein